MRLLKHNAFISVLVIIRGSSPLASAFCIIIAIYQIIFIIMLIFNKYVGEYFYSGKYNKSKHNKKYRFLRGAYKTVLEMFSGNGMALAALFHHIPSLLRIKKASQQA